MSMRLIVSMLFLMPLVAQQAPTNLKILTPAEVGPAMQSFTAGLGVRCEFCHVQGDRASDANPHKVVARDPGAWYRSRVRRRILRQEGCGHLRRNRLRRP